MTAVQTLPLKKLVVELRYKPELGFYAKMDSVGVKLADEFPDWERSALTVEVRDKKRHRRVFMGHNRCFFEADAPDLDSVFQFASGVLNNVCTGLSIGIVQRIGVRQWFAVDLKKSFALIVDEISNRFFLRSGDLSAILPDKTHDLAYTMIYETSEGWKYLLRLGPMVRKEWFQYIHHEPNLFQVSEEGEKSFDKFRESVPEHFLFIDIDSHREDYPAQKLEEFLTAVRRKTETVVPKLIDFCKR